MTYVFLFLSPTLVYSLLNKDLLDNMFAEWKGDTCAISIWYTMLMMDSMDNKIDLQAS